eukprot:CAMPEP_0181319170 /NCGR_PEP_ID=MMETSP1101-20121128/17421_1 /TAXON_ID=46948 /ORGANISM="Rhodomonas abbreviata, Strain Caron Lab Isolate" /LENGTH=232 /DNA_ID=CAMNT_0023426737 /DNA_START=20 /DNA_END=718 /DNA_ORIENTATION=+
MTSRDDYIFAAKLAETAERYDEMQEAIRNAIMADAKLSVEERSLFASAYKHVAAARRSTARMITDLENKEADATSKGKIKEYRDKVETELNQICNDAITLVDANLLPAAGDDVEAQVFFHKLKGDYCRYLAEFQKDAKRQADCDKGLEAYTAAQKLCEGLAATNPLRLGLSLNMAVFYFEILKDNEKAIALAQKGFDDAVDEMDSLSEAQYKESSQIIQLLRDNLSEWQKVE